MTVVWGDWSPNGHVRIGLDQWYVGADLHTDVWYNVTAAFTADSCQLYYWGDLTGSDTQTVTWAANTSGIIHSYVWTQAYNSSLTINFELNNLNDTGDPYSRVGPITQTLAPLAPNAPTAQAATRVSDTQTNLTWTRNPSSTRPYASQKVLRRACGSTVDVEVATLSDSASSYSDKTVVADRGYSYSIAAVNSTATTASGLTACVYSTPAAPSAYVLTRPGADIALSWTSGSTYATTFEVWHGTVTGGVTTWDGAALATVTGTTYTHTGPSQSLIHIYRVRAKSPVNPGGGYLYSGYLTTAVVPIPVKPNPPTGLAFAAPVQAGAVIDAAGATVLTWAHNSVDISTQTAYEMNYQVSTNNGATWGTAVATGKITSTAMARTVAAATWANGVQVRWQVRTWGMYAGTAPTYSAWSAWSTIYTSARPLGTITSGATCALSTLTATAAYYDAEGTTQAGARWTLRTVGGDTLESATLGAGDPGLLTYAFTTALADATSYVVAYAVQDGSGLWSAEVTQTVAVAYAHPPVPTVALMWSTATGAVTVQIGNPAPVGAEIAAVSNSVYRDGLLIASGLVLNALLVDRIPPLSATVAYRVVAYSALPSQASATASVSTTVATDCRVWLNAGPGFGLSASVVANPVVDTEQGRARARIQYAGRPAPVMYDGESMPWSGTLSGDADVATLAALEAVCEAKGVGCYRDPDGRRVFVSFGFLREKRGAGTADLKGFSVPLDRVSYAE